MMKERRHTNINHRQRNEMKGKERKSIDSCVEKKQHYRLPPVYDCSEAIRFFFCC